MKQHTISAEEFDRRFDDGEDMADYIDWSKATRPGAGTQHVDVGLTADTVRRLDVEAARHGVSRAALIERWITDRLDHAA